MKNILWMDLRDIKWVIFWVTIVVIPLSNAVYRFDWGLYQAANKQPLSDSIAMIAAYVPLAVIWLGSSSEGSSTRLATLACLPISRTKLALSRYATPVVVQILIMGLVTLVFAVGWFLQDWLYLRGTNAESMLGTTSYHFLKSFLLTLPSQIALGAVYVAIPLALDDVFPKVRAKSYGLIAILATSFLLSQMAAAAKWYFAIYRLEYVIPFALAMVGLEVLLFNRRRVIA